MKAIVINQYGSPAVLEDSDLPIPTLKSQEVLVEVHACGLNPIDFKLRSGSKKEIMPLIFPFTPGCDVSGVIVDLGNEVVDFKIGDEVYFANQLTLGGGYAQFCAVDAKIVALKPKSINHVQASSLPIVALTTIQALRDFADLQAAHKILIHAGAGGVGSFAIQYAKSLGAKVYTTASRKNHQYLLSLGADHCIDYNTEDFLKICEDEGKMDVVFETLGQLNYTRSILAAKTSGVVSCIVNPPDSDVLALSQLKNIKTDFVLVTSSKNDLDYIAKLVDEGKVKPQVQSIINFDLQDIQTAHKLLESGHSKGKIVIKIR